MKQKLLLKAMLLLCALVAGSSSVWATDYSKTYNYSDIGAMFGDGSNYADADSYWKVPESAGNTATISIPITYQPTSNITITFSIATFGSGTDPSSSNTTITAVGTESGSNWSGSSVSSYPSSKTYVDGTMTITKPVSPTTLGGLTITMGVNSGVKILRLQSITISYTYTASSDPSSNISFTNTAPSLDLKDAATYTQLATTADGYSETDGASVTYSITANTAGATINASTGVVTPTKAGSVIVQASAAAIAGKFAASSATYTLTVTDTREFTVTCHTGATSNDVVRVSGATLSLEDPAAICGMSFVGWSSTNNAASPTWVANTTKVTDDMELYAMYEEVAGEYSYHLVESSQADWRGDYLIAYSSAIFADGRVGGTGDNAMGKQNVSVNPDTNLSGKKVAASWGDTYNVTIVAINDSKLSDGYLLKTKDGKYNYQTSNANGLAATDNKATAANYPLSITYNSSSDIDIAISAGAQFHYNTDGYFRFYKDGGQKSVYLYKRTEDAAPVYSLGLTAKITLNAACTDGEGNYYGTYSCSSAFVVPAGLTVSEINVDESQLAVTNYDEGDIVPANTGVMVSSTTSGDHNITLAAGGTSVLGANNMLKPSGEAGIDAATMNVADTKFYRLTMHNGTQIGFWWGAASGAAFDLAANKAYLAVPESALATAPSLLWFDNGSTGVDEVRGKMEEVRGDFFDLQGRKVANPTKGLYIVNGKKVVIK